MGFTRITSSDTANKGVVGLPDTPGLTTADMQKKFDEISLDVIIPKLNALMNELESEVAASYIGATVPSGISAEKNVQSILEKIATVAASASKAADEAISAARGAEEKIFSAVNAANSAVATANQAVNVAYGIMNMVDPVTGHTLPINQVIYNLYNAMRPAPLTAGEYDALGLTAAEYDAYGITAYNYDMYAKNILTQ